MLNNSRNLSEIEIERKTSEWKKLKSEIQRHLCQAYWTHTENLFGKENEADDGSSKKFWKYIKSQRNEENGVSPLKINGKLELDAIKKAEALNAQFYSAFSPYTTFTEAEFEARTGMSAHPPPSTPIIDPINITQAGVQKLLEGLNPKKACGPDGITPRILKELAPELAPALTTLFRSSLTTGEVPLDWRTANVTPVFKKGEKYKPENYRPISLTSTVCKTMEHILVSHIMNFAENNILCKEQHGFRKRRNCESQLIGLIDQITDSLEQGQDSDVLIMDFSKAFDKVIHSLLLHKLNHFDITGEVNRWIGSFLRGRRQAVVVEGEASSFVDVASGVPQGSVLGPCLFLLYINDLPKNLNSTARLFADDTLCHANICCDSDKEALQEDLDHLADWEQKWSMAFHPDKCQTMTISRKRQRSQRTYKLRDHTLTKTKEATCAGMRM